MRLRSLKAVILVLLCAVSVCASSNGQRDITVKDSIEMTRWADADYLLGANPESGIANFSPDGRHFVIVLRKADLAKNANVYSVYLFTTSKVFDSEVPRVLVRMSSTSNDFAIRGVKWLKDSQTLAFVGVREPGRSQVYTLNTRTRRLTERTDHRTGVDQFDISPDGKRIIFTAKPEAVPSVTEDQRRHGVLVENQTLEQILTGKFNQSARAERLFYLGDSEVEVKAPEDHEINPYTRIFFSPNGEFVSFTAFFRRTSPSWGEYQSDGLRFWSRNPAPLGGAAPVFQYFLLDCSTRSIHPLLNAPAIYTAALRWARDSHAVYVKTFLPLEGVSPKERDERAGGELPAEIALPSLTIQRIGSATWEQTLPFASPDRPKILVKEDLDTPPKIIAQDRRSTKGTAILDLNPQFAKLSFGRVEELHLLVDGVPVLGGMYLPPGFVAGRRYPLVVQTHGFDPDRFSMDGRDEWSSGFAARALTASGMIVVQMEHFANPADHDNVGNDRSLGSNFEQSFRDFSIDCDKQVIHYLTNRGLIDPDRVGISGFSRTVWFVSYLLTHSSEPKFRAAVLTDGIDAGYFEYIAGRITEFNEDNGGKTPFSQDGLEQWMRESPSFHLDRVCIPLRLVAIEDPLAQWEWFAAGKMQQKPVELIDIPGGSHLLERPRDRQIAMQGIVDWFRFWLEDYVNPDPDRREQYARWEKLRTLESHEDHTDCAR
jgi:dipeptidyl aminopeptidase/acylaminoacyl peptidase